MKHVSSVGTCSLSDWYRPGKVQLPVSQLYTVASHCGVTGCPHIHICLLWALWCSLLFSMCLSCDTAIYTVHLSRIMWHCHLPCALVMNYVTPTSSLFTCHELCDTDIFPVHLSRTMWHWHLPCALVTNYVTLTSSLSLVTNYVTLTSSLSLVTNYVTLTSSLCTCHELCDTDIFPVHLSRTMWHRHLHCALVTNYATPTSSLCTSWCPVWMQWMRW